MQGPLFKKYYKFQDRNNRALNQSWGFSECRALCNCIGHMPMMLAVTEAILYFIIQHPSAPLLLRSVHWGRHKGPPKFKRKKNNCTSCWEWPWSGRVCRVGKVAISENTVHHKFSIKDWLTVGEWKRIRLGKFIVTTIIATTYLGNFFYVGCWLSTSETSPRLILPTPHLIHTMLLASLLQSWYHREVERSYSE